MSSESLDAVSFMAVYGSLSKTKEQGFEGPEKRLEVIIRWEEDKAGLGLRDAPRSAWDTVVGSLHAKIVSEMKNDHFDAFVLTESSLFVTKNRILLITCGTTILLDSLPHIMKVVKELGLEVEWASFMRKNYSYPWEQKGPHSSLENEYLTLKGYFPRGQPFMFGPVDSDHYFFYSFDDIRRPHALENDTQMSMTMYDLEEDFAQTFFSPEFHSAGEKTAEIRAKSGLDRLFPAPWDVQDLQFAPCGYSVNAICGPEYQTIHITPESHCSFASYETNSSAANLHPRMQLVLSVFRPKRFTVVVMLDPHSAVGEAFAGGEAIGIEAKWYPEYQLKTRTINEFAPGYTAIVINFVKPTLPAASPLVKAQ
jgi:S-adenosylmethionine decarboxylase